MNRNNSSGSFFQLFFTGRGRNNPTSRVHSFSISSASHPVPIINNLASVIAENPQIPYSDSNENRVEDESILEDPVVQSFLYEDAYQSQVSIEDSGFEFSNPLHSNQAGRDAPTIGPLRSVSSAATEQSYVYNHSYTLPAPRPRPGQVQQGVQRITIRTQIAFDQGSSDSNAPYSNDIMIPSDLISESVPHYFKCPISFDIMRNPVVCSDGQTYERAFIAEWLKKSSLSPMTKQHIKILFPNYALRSAIEDFVQTHSNQRK
jgi:hypothetical protein